MKKTGKIHHSWNFISLLFVLCMTMVFLPTVAYAANGPMGPVTDPSGNTYNFAYIKFLKIDENGNFKYDEEWNCIGYDVFADNQEQNDALNGAIYNRSSNTLTITNLKAENLVLETNCMGDDFKLNVIGDCSIAQIRIWGYGYGGTLNITGNGALSVNSKKLYDNAIVLYAEGSNSSLNFGKNVRVNLYAKVDVAKITTVTYTDIEKAFTFSNGQNFTVTKSNMIWERDVYYEGYESSELEDEYAGSYTQKVVNSADPEGIYGCSETTEYDGEGNVTAHGFTVTKLVYNEKYNAYFRDSSMEEQFLTDEEFTKSTYSYSVDSDGNKDWLYPCHCYGSTYKIYTDGKSNLYAIYNEYSSVSEDKYAMTVEKIDGVNDQYMFIPDKTVDISTLEPYTEKIIQEDYYIYTLNGTDFVYKGLPEEAHIHKYNSGVVTKAATCTATGIKTYTCTICGETKQESIAKKAHTYKTTTTKATTSKDGQIVKTCKVCKKTVKTPIYKASSIKLSKTSFTYNGKAQKPTVTVKNSKGTTLKNGTDYTVKYDSGCKNTGKYAVTITFKGNYSGTKTLYFNILPGKTSSLKASQSTTSIKATWKAVIGASGYKVTLYNSKNKAVKTVDTTKTTYTFSKLSKGTTYKVRVTAYKTIDSKKVLSSVYTQLTTATKTDAPSIKVTSTAKKTAKISWSKVSGATGYTVYYSTSKNGTYKKLGSTTSTSYTYNKLSSGKTYYFKVASNKKVGSTTINSAYSAVKSVKVK